MHPLIIGPLVTAGLSSILALVISVTDKIVNDYGEVSVDINGGKKKLAVRGGSHLLGTLATENIFVASACGGRGTCGACKVKVLSDVGPHLPTELPYMNAEEVEANTRLACQVKLKKDIAIEIPESLFNIRKFRTRIESIKDLTYDIKELYLALSDADVAAGGIAFECGQYAQLVAPPYDGIKESTQRAYSMSSSPLDKAHIELLVRLVPGGIVTTWVHTQLKVGDEVEVIGPFGEFGVKDTDALMVCVAGGSGMAPFKSMLNHILETNAYPGKEIWYFFGARSKRDMFYLQQMAELEGKIDRFHFVPALSEPNPEDAWNGPTGLITDVLDTYIKDKMPKGRPMEGYLCGSPGMIDACIKVMSKNGMTQDKIYFDKF
ncbi:MAG: oxidoreductase [Treponema sp. GWB1_62_6]|nr:MAG: oxidoreductase [Treponema sp. GWA1_62_8]OHE67035.1 MAG: oxidoreductase [Treponema sp. GWC1_61_84]OHE72570.1 MAG: oxidoreductase [Treponema sp. GWB1_62_6]OHE73280.1 MAG: oxidoreductase [Treponema sp. RIFOXYC1_FULL_61_9]HCM27338.1 oxidoreductase [Treponema sp.]